MARTLTGGVTRCAAALALAVAGVVGAATEPGTALAGFRPLRLPTWLLPLASPPATAPRVCGLGLRVAPAPPPPLPSVAGTVVDEDGTPVAGAGVSLVPFPDPATAYRQEGAWRAGIETPPPVATTGADGSFTVPVDPAEPCFAVARREGYLEGGALAARGRPLRIMLAVPRSLRGSVSRGDGGSVGDARVLVEAPPRLGLPVSAEATTTPGGTFLVEGLPPEGPWTVTVLPRHDSRLRAARLDSIAPGTQDLRVALRDGRTMNGFLRDPRRLPVADATVYLVPSAGAEPDFAREAVTDGEGRFAAPGLGPGPWDVSVLPPGAREDAYAGGRFLRGSRERCLPGSVELDVVPAAALAGRVVYEDGTATRGEGRVSIRSDRETTFRSVRVQPDGTFRAEGLDPTRTWDIVAEEFDSGRSAILMAWTAPDEGLVVRVSTRYDLEGTVLLEDGSAAPSGIRVRAVVAEGDQRHPGRSGEAVTDDAGRFVIRRLHDFEYRVTAGDGKEWVQPDGAVTAHARYSVRLRVERRPALRVRLMAPDGYPVRQERARVRWAGLPRGASAALKDGRLDVTGPARADFAEIWLATERRAVLVAVLALPRDGADVVVPAAALEALDAPADAPLERASGLQAEAFGIALPEGVCAVEGVLAYPAAVTGLVRDREGRPVPGATAAIRPAPARGSAPAAPPPALAVATTDADGRFRTPVLPGGSYRVEVSAEGFGPVQPRESHPERPDLEFTLDRGLVIGGRVLGPDGVPVPRVPVLLHEGERHVAYTTTNASGEFLLGPMQHGAFDLVLGARDLDAELPGSLLAKRVTGVAAGTRDLEVRLERGLAIEGVVVGADGTALDPEVLKAVTVGLNAAAGFRRGRGATPGEGGRFRFGSLPAGTYRLTATARAASVFDLQDHVDVVLAAETPAVRLRLPLGAAAAGRVEDAEGRPVVGVFLGFSREEPGAGGYAATSLRTDAAGAFSTGPLHADREHVISWDPGGGAAWCVRRVRAGDADVVLRPEPGYAISGTVTDGEGAPVAAGLHVSAVELGAGNHVAPHQARYGPTDAAGRFTIAGLSPGTRYALRAGGYGSDYLYPREGTVVEAATDGLVLRVRRAAEVSGVLVRADGTPAAGVLLTARWSGDGEDVQSPFPQVVTGPDGAFVLRPVRSGRVRLVAGAGDREIDLGEHDAPTKGLRVELREGR